jgi:pantoate--beta-alanine ligase
MSRTDPRVLRNVRALQGWAERERRAGRRIALVPTMGALHEGHLGLARLAAEHADRVVVSIFVNPTQFAPGGDYDRYPRDLAGDAAKLAGLADVVFAPDPEEIYPQGDATWVEVTGLTEGLCGPFRPGHFRGVTTVVARLFNAARPHVAVFGEKDYQQLQVLRRMARDLQFGVEIVAGPTHREADGLAMSSRNAYLSQEGRRQARALHDGLAEARALAETGETDAARLASAVRVRIEKEPLARVQYVELRDAESLESLERLDRRAVLAVAAFVEDARLIDNVVLEVR